MLFILSVVIIAVVLLGLIYVYQEKLIFFPEKVAANTKYLFPQRFKEIYLPAPDGATIHALHFRTSQPKGVILYFHGNAGSLRSWGYLAADLLLYGYDVLMPDYRSFGKSTGKLSQMALYQDAQLTYNYLKKEYPENNIIIFGRSVGTGVATKLAADNNARLLILETPFYNFADVAKTHYSFLPASLLLRYTFRSDQFLPQVSCPVFIFHGTADEIVPFRSGLMLARLLLKPENLIVIEGGGHNNLSCFAVYNQALQRILK